MVLKDGQKCCLCGLKKLTTAILIKIEVCISSDAHETDKEEKHYV